MQTRVDAEPVWNPVREADSLENRRARWLDAFYPHIAHVYVEVKKPNGDLVRLWGGNVRECSIIEMGYEEDSIRIVVTDPR